MTGNELRSKREMRKHQKATQLKCRCLLNRQMMEKNVQYNDKYYYDDFMYIATYLRLNKQRK